MSGNVVMSGISENVRYHKNEAQATLVLRTECKKQVICVPGAEDPRHTTFINLNVLHAESAETLAALSGWPLCGRPFPRIPRHWSWQPRNWIMHFDVLCQLCCVLKIIQNSLKTSKGVWMQDNKHLFQVHTEWKSGVAIYDHCEFHNANGSLKSFQTEPGERRWPGQN